MAIKTNRARDEGKITIDYERCNACGLCVRVCMGGPLYIEDGALKSDRPSDFGCLACGHCALVCPKDAISVFGRDLTAKDIVKKPSSPLPSYQGILTLMTTRRSVRLFEDKEVPRPVIEKIVEAASTAPMGIPPSDVELLILNGRKKVRDFSFEIIDEMKKTRWLFSPLSLFLMRPILGKTYYEAMRDFVNPLVTLLVDKRNEGTNWLLYDAPLAIYFYASPYSDPADSTIAATYAMLAAESLGLGSTMIGSVGPFLKYGGKKIKLKYAIPKNHQPGIVVIFGYPKVKFIKAVKRRLGRVNYF